MSSTSALSDCPFLDIPAELRIMIYEEVISAFDVNGNNTPPLVMTCRLVRREALPVYNAKLCKALQHSKIKCDEVEAKRKELGLKNKILDVKLSAFDLIFYVREMAAEAAEQVQVGDAPQGETAEEAGGDGD